MCHGSYKTRNERIDSRILPACGDGNFLREILNRKLPIVKSRMGKAKKNVINIHSRCNYKYLRDFLLNDNCLTMLKKDYLTLTWIGIMLFLKDWKMNNYLNA